MQRVHHVDFRPRARAGLQAADHPLLDTMLRGCLLVGMGLLPSLPALTGDTGSLLRWSFWLLLAPTTSLLLIHRQGLFNRVAALRRAILVRPSRRRPRSPVPAMPFQKGGQAMKLREAA